MKIKNKKTKEIIEILSKKINKPKSEIIDNAIKIYAYVYGQICMEDKDVIFRDKDGNNERKLQFSDFLK